MLRSIARFNSVDNLDGRLCRVLVGSKVIREGLNFRAVRHLLVMSIPTDYPTLLQVFGRVVRKDSHRELPPDRRDVRIRVFVGVRAGAPAAPTPELQRYIDKGQEFLVIQQVERALHAGAVDSYVNYPRIATALGGPPEDAPDSLDALPYRPALGPAAAAALRPTTVTFDAYSYGPRTVAAAVSAAQGLFAARPVWTFADLWAAFRAGAVRNNYDPSAFTEADVAAALLRLARPGQWPSGGVSAVCRAGPYYILTAVSSADTVPRPDVEAWLRAPGTPLQALPHVSVSVGNYVRGARAGETFATRLRAFDEKYLQKNYALELSLVELGGAFHTELLKKIIVSLAAPTSAGVTSNDAAVAELYTRFRIGVTLAEALKTPSGARLKIKRAAAELGRLIGYATPEYVSLYDPAAARWFNAPLAEFKYGRRHRENDIVVGFVTPVDPTGTASDAARFKLRPALQVLQRRHLGSAKTVDVRTIARGAVCETRPREELDKLVKRLRAALPPQFAVRASAADNDDAADNNGAADNAADNAADDAADSAKTITTSDYKFAADFIDLASADPSRPPVVATENNDLAGQLSADEWPAEWPSRADAIDWPLSFAVRYDRTRGKRFPSASDMCDAIRLYLLALEERSRRGASGMADGLRWLYLFADKPPSVASLGTA